MDGLEWPVSTADAPPLARGSRAQLTACATTAPAYAVPAGQDMTATPRWIVRSTALATVSAAETRGVMLGVGVPRDGQEWIVDSRLVSEIVLETVAA